jgi:hypothetical protein
MSFIIFSSYFESFLHFFISSLFDHIKTFKAVIMNDTNNKDEINIHCIYDQNNSTMLQRFFKINIHEVIFIISAYTLNSDS